jgi:hypothetical protein
MRSVRRSILFACVVAVDCSPFTADDPGVDADGDATGAWAPTDRPMGAWTPIRTIEDNGWRCRAARDRQLSTQLATPGGRSRGLLQADLRCNSTCTTELGNGCLD